MICKFCVNHSPITSSLELTVTFVYSSEKKSSDQIVEEIATDILHQLPETVEELAEGDVRASTSGIFMLRLKHILTRELPDLRDKEKNRCKFLLAFFNFIKCRQ